MRLFLEVWLICFLARDFTKVAGAGGASSTYPEHRARFDGLVDQANLIRSDSRDSTHAALQGRVNDLLANLVNAFGTEGLPTSLLRSTVERFLRRPDSVSSIDSHPKISLALALLNTLDYCSGAKATIRLCTASNKNSAGIDSVGMWTWIEVSEVAKLLCNPESQRRAVATGSSGGGGGGDEFADDSSAEVARITSVDNRTRAKSQLPLLRAEAARRVNALVAETSANSSGTEMPEEATISLAFGALRFLVVVYEYYLLNLLSYRRSASPDLVLNTVQLHSIESRVGASAAYCAKLSRPGWHVPSPGIHRGIAPPGQSPIIVAFGTNVLCSALLQSAKQAGVEVWI
jgi:hypothetical protein